MNYFVKRDLQEFGPYSLADLQRYVGTGNILLTDLARSEGMTEWMPVSSVIGTIPVFAASAQRSYAAPAREYPLPPGLNWAVVILLAIVTFAIFLWIWFFVQASFVKKLVPENRARLWGGIGLGLSLGAGLLQASLGHGDTQALLSIMRLAGMGFWVAANFSLKHAIEEHYNSAENIGLSLSGGMTFFFNVIYFQYHFNKIRDARKQQRAFAAGA